MQDLSEDILKKAGQGDLKAFETVYKAAADFVYNVALRVVNNRQDAEEVTQEVFLTIYDKLKDFRFESSFKTWVYRITVNRSINASKKASKMKNNPSEYEVQLETVQVPSEVSKTIETEHQKNVVDRLLSAVDSDQRACVVLRNIEGLSYQEIAETLKININTVRSRLKRAREKMLNQNPKVLHENM